jgi:O-antigen ligase
MNSEALQRKLSELLSPLSIMGALTALFLMMGRWSPFRPETNWDELVVYPLYIELRFYLIAVMLILGLIFANRLPRGASRLNFSFVCFMLFLFIGIASGFETPGQGVLLDYFARKQADFILLALAMPVIYFYSASEEFRLEVWKWIYRIALTLMVLAIISVLEGLEDRLAVLSGGPNVFGRLMGLLVIAAGALYFTEARLISVSGVVLGLASFVLLSSGSRGATAAMAVTLAFVALMFRRSPRKVALLLAVSACGILLILYPPFEIFEMINERYVVLTIQEGYVSSRDVLLEIAIDAIRERFWLGHGLAGFSEFEPVQVYPHNLVLELWTEFGLLGLILGLGVPLIAVINRIRRPANLDKRNIFAFIFLLVATMFSGDFYDSRGVYVFAFLILGQSGRQARPVYRYQSLRPIN